MSSNDWKTIRSDKLYDYIKFHLGLYIATPPAYGLLGEALNLTSKGAYKVGLVILVGTCLVAGLHASIFVTRYLFGHWTDLKRWHDMGEKAMDPQRRFFQHHIYWIALISALLCLVVAYEF